ncbi:MAG: membrane dipeptidase, partial [Acidobacteria bacterium]|nr:membrane dipeptidase [Acidobacteriota bacterium]
ILGVLLLAGSAAALLHAQQKLPAVSAAAEKLHRRAIVIDLHADTPQRMLFDKGFDFAMRNPRGHVDIPKMREGGLDAVFMSIWAEGDYTGPKVVKRSLDLIDAVYEVARKNSKDVVMATTAADIRRASSEGKLALLLGMEGGHMIDDDLGMLRMYAGLGVRYMTLSHFLNTNWSDSSTDKPRHNGLTGFGKDVVREMNRLGVMVDISHVADKTFYDALEVTKAPVIASHSSCRIISNHPRNMSDDMLRALAKNGGVVHINYHADFLSQEYLDANRALGKEVQNSFKELEAKCGDDEACKILASEQQHRELTAAGKLPRVSWEKIIEHIDHALKIAGVDHVGLGSDFDGANMPEGVNDASMLPRITDGLLKKGYSETDILKILGGNTLRVMEQVEKVSRELNAVKK